MSKALKTKKSHLYRPYPPGEEDFGFITNGSVPNDDPIVSGISGSLTHNEWDDWNVTMFESEYNHTEELENLSDADYLDNLFGYPSSHDNSSIAAAAAATKDQQFSSIPSIATEDQRNSQVALSAEAKHGASETPQEGEIEKLGTSLELPTCIALSTTTVSSSMTAVDSLSPSSVMMMAASSQHTMSTNLQQHLVNSSTQNIPPSGPLVMNTGVPHVMNVNPPQFFNPATPQMMMPGWPPSQSAMQMPMGMFPQAMVPGLTPGLMPGMMPGMIPGVTNPMFGQYVHAGMYPPQSQGISPMQETTGKDDNQDAQRKLQRGDLDKAYQSMQKPQQQFPSQMMMVPPGMMMYPYGMVPYPNMFGVGMTVAMPAMKSSQPQVMNNASRDRMGASPSEPALVSIARKPGDEEPSQSLQLLLQDEEEKRAKKLERNRNGARDSRKKNQDYVEGLEAAIKQLHVARSIIADHQWGNRDASLTKEDFNKLRDDLLGETALSSITADDATIFVKAGRLRKTVRLPPHHRDYFVIQHYSSIGTSLQEMQNSLLNIGAILTAGLEASPTNVDSCGDITAELRRLLKLTPDQLEQIAACREDAAREARNMAIIVRCFKALRNMSMQFTSHIHVITSDFNSVLSQTQEEKLLLWSEKNQAAIRDISFQDL